MGEGEKAGPRIRTFDSILGKTFCKDGQGVFQEEGNSDQHLGEEEAGPSWNLKPAGVRAPQRVGWARPGA